MKTLTLLTSILILSCNEQQKTESDRYYPFVVKKIGLQSKYDIAVKEMYRLNTCCDCNCQARGFSKHGYDTLRIIDLNLKLERLIQNSDTLTFTFSYYSVIESDTILFQPFSKSFSCCLFNSISFKGDSAIPFPLSFGCATIVEFNRDTH